MTTWTTPNGAFRLSGEEAGGMPNFAKALSEGVRAKYLPKQLAENLLQTQLLNKMRRPYADNADQWFQAELGLKNLVGQNYGSLINKRVQDAKELELLRQWNDNSSTGNNGNPGNTRYTQGELTEGVDQRGNPIEEEEEEEEIGERAAADRGSNSFPSTMEPPGLPKKIPPYIQMLAKKHNMPIGEQDPIRLARFKADQQGISKEQQELADEMRSLQQQYQNVAAIDKLLQENPNLTGFIPGILNAFGLGSRSAGEFQANTIPLQAALARELSSRGGSQAANLASAGKPDIWSNVYSNKGKVKGLTDKIMQAMDIDARRYKELTGKDAPFKIKSTVTVINPKGKRFEIDQESARNLPKGWKHG